MEKRRIGTREDFMDQSQIDENRNMSMLSDMSISSFLDKVASDSPLPGGGGVAALAAALAAGLCEMVANLTIGRKKYE